MFWSETIKGRLLFHVPFGEGEKILRLEGGDFSILNPKLEYLNPQKFKIRMTEIQNSSFGLSRD